jgi:CheY-like chemotaxis protein
VKKIRHQGRKAFLINIIGLDQRKQREVRLSRALKVEALARAALSMNREINGCLSILDKYVLPHKRMGAVTDTDLADFLRRAEALREKGNAIAQKMGILADGEHGKSGHILLDLNRVVQDAVALAQFQYAEDFEDRGDRISVKTYMRTLSPVEGHLKEMQDVFTNMISNAMDALPPEGGEIHLTTEEDAGFAYIYIQDNGEGIPNDVNDKIFDPFFSTKDASHLGLGLSLAYAIITRHGGEIDVMSQEGRGATFITKLPLAKRPSLAKAKGAASRIKNSQILIIADEGMVKDLLAELFESKGGEVIGASTGTEGLKLLKKSKIDLVIADANTAYLDPWKFIPKMKKTGQIPIALINVERDDRSLQALKKLGAELIIQRPLETDRILSLVSKALATRGPSG